MARGPVSTKVSFRLRASVVGYIFFGNGESTKMTQATFGQKGEVGGGGKSVQLLHRRDPTRRPPTTTTSDAAKRKAIVGPTSTVPLRSFIHPWPFEFDTGLSLRTSPSPL